MQKIRIWTTSFACAAYIVSIAENSGQANAPMGRYTNLGDTVYDTETHLTWQQPVSPGSYTWANAKTYCEGLNLPGTGWRVPSFKEVQTIIDETKTNPAIDSLAFPNTTNAAFWTSSRSSVVNAAAVSFVDGGTSNPATSFLLPVRCVR